MKRICLVSGGTGGHLMPALVLARAMQDAGAEPVLVTEGRDVERELLRRELPGVTSIELPRSMADRGFRSLCSLPFWLSRATVVARRLLKKNGVAGVVSTGGRASLPVALAARSLGLPLFLLEQNAVTGRANRWLLPLARRIYLGLPMVGESHPRALATGTPLRTGFSVADRTAARRSHGLRPEAPVVLVTGGSQGARVLNDLVPEALVQVAANGAAGRGLQVMHLSGLGNDAAVRHRYAAGARDLVAHVRPVAADMDRLFAAADLVVCRSGGTTVAELMAIGRAAILVPYPHHRDRQQLHNARVLECVGAAVVIEEHRLQQVVLAELIDDLLADPARLTAMGEQGRLLGRPDAAAVILADITRVLEGAASADSGPVEDGAAPIPGSLAPGSLADAPARSLAAVERRGGVA